MRPISKHLAAFAVVMSTLGAVGTAFANTPTSAPTSEAPADEPTSTPPTADPTDGPTDGPVTPARDPHWCCG